MRGPSSGRYLGSESWMPLRAGRGHRVVALSLVWFRCALLAQPSTILYSQGCHLLPDAEKHGVVVNDGEGMNMPERVVVLCDVGGDDNCFGQTKAAEVLEDRSFVLLANGNDGPHGSIMVHRIGGRHKLDVGH